MFKAKLSVSRQLGILAAITLATALLAAQDTSTIYSKGTVIDHLPNADPDSPFWKSVQGVATSHDNMGKPTQATSMQIRSRWTDRNLYLLFTCAYSSLNLKPHPTTTRETNELWKWDVVEAFIGDDFANINRYKEFEVSPQGEWVDLDIDRSHTGSSPDAWHWDSGFTVKARVDSSNNIWYAEMRIPFTAISRKPPAPGLQLRINFFHAEGHEPDRLMLTWQPTHAATFHVPAAFGVLRLAPTAVP